MLSARRAARGTPAEARLPLGIDPLVKKTSAGASGACKASDWDDKGDDHAICLGGTATQLARSSHQSAQEAGEAAFDDDAGEGLSR